MADNERKLATYRRAVWGRVWADWRSTRDRVIWNSVVGIISLVLGAIGGARVMPGPGRSVRLAA